MVSKQKKKTGSRQSQGKKAKPLFTLPFSDKPVTAETERIIVRTAHRRIDKAVRDAEHDLELLDSSITDLVIVQNYIARQQEYDAEPRPIRAEQLYLREVAEAGREVDPEEYIARTKARRDELLDMGAASLTLAKWDGAEDEEA